MVGEDTEPIVEMDGEVLTVSVNGKQKALEFTADRVETDSEGTHLFHGGEFVCTVRQNYHGGWYVVRDRTNARNSPMDTMQVRIPKKVAKQIMEKMEVAD